MNDCVYIDFKLLKEEQIVQLAHLHRSCLPSLLSSLGEEVLAQFYRLAQHDPLVLGIVAVDPHDNTILGWAFGTPDPTTIHAKLRADVFWFLQQLLVQSFKNPLLGLQLLCSILTSYSLPPGEGKSIELLYIGVMKQHQGKGIGAMLLQQFLSAASRADYTQVTLSVEVENTHARSLYEKHNFHCVKKIREGWYHRYRMACSLTRLLDQHTGQT